MKNSAVLVLVLAVGVLTGGCVRRDEIRYPSEWSEVASTPAGACPVIEGRYVNTGTVAGECDKILGEPVRGHARFRGNWGCQVSLASNIADLKSSEWFEIRQPDSDTIVVASSDPAIGTKELHRSKGDYSCGADGITRSQHFNVASLGDDSAQTGTGSAVLSTLNSANFLFQGGVVGLRTLTRRFEPAKDGSLVMSVSRTDAMTVLMIPAYIKDATFVRWQRVPSDAATLSEVPAATVQATVPVQATLPVQAVAAVTGPSAQSLR